VKAGREAGQRGTPQRTCRWGADADCASAPCNAGGSAGRRVVDDRDRVVKSTRIGSR